MRSEGTKNIGGRSDTIRGKVMSVAGLMRRVRGWGNM